MEEYFTGWIKPGCYNKTFKDGCESYSLFYKSWQVPILRFCKLLQKSLWYLGIAVHDPVFGECTPDFNCCCDTGRRAFIKIPQREVTIY